MHLQKDTELVNNFLKSNNWIYSDEELTALEVPGEGNMNFTLRCKLNSGKSFILKQSRDFVEKYPQIAAPEQRVLEEARFYDFIKDDAFLKDRTPSVLQLNRESHIMMMEDLGEGSDYTALYKKDVQLKENELEELIAFIAHLHKNFNKQSCEETITNREMRALNHEHIFVLPFEKDNGLNLDDIMPGLAEVSNLATNNSKLKEAVKSLGQKYLEDGAQLLHGDYFPGSWLKTANGIKIIDPEFCFFGPAEFELGVCLAHLYMAEQPKEFIQKAINIYKKDAPLNDMLMMKFMAVEMLRRILGVAQLPLQLSLNERKALVERSILIITEY